MYRREKMPQLDEFKVTELDEIGHRFEIGGKWRIDMLKTQCTLQCNDEDVPLIGAPVGKRMQHL
jgi:hypothetical protein